MCLLPNKKSYLLFWFENILFWTLTWSDKAASSSSRAAASAESAAFVSWKKNKNKTDNLIC
jgi:hypothetical protein